MAEAEPINEAPPSDDFCTKVPDPPNATAIRFYGGLTLSPQLDPAKSGATSCSSSLSLISKMEPALAPLSPILSILDAVCHIAQCLLIMKEVITNPFKVPDMLKCIPEMVAKVNQLLALVPPFPQGLVSMLQMALDILTTAQTELDCVITQLRAIDGDLKRVEDLINKVNNAEDELLASSLLDQANCAKDTADNAIQSVLSVLGPVARIICTMRTFLALTGDKGKEIAKRLKLPGLDNIKVLDDAIQALTIFNTILATTIEIIEQIGFPLGLEPPPSLVFKCKLDDDDSSLSSTPPPPTPIPTLVSVTPNTTAGVTNHPDLQVSVIATNIDESTQFFLNTSQLTLDGVTGIPGSDSKNALVTIPGGLLPPGARTFQLTAVNVPPGGTSPFSGLSQQAGGTPDSTSAQTSNQIPFTVT